jgi:hypothetical protein
VKKYAEMKKYFIKLVLPLIPLAILIIASLRDVSHFSSILFFGLGIAAEAFILLKDRTRYSNTTTVVFWIIFGAGLLTLLYTRGGFGLNPGELFAIFYVLLVLGFFLIYYKTIILPLNEIVLAIWNLFFWYLYFKNHQISLDLLTDILIFLTALSFILIFLKNNLGVLWRMFLYAWFLIITISVTLMISKSGISMPFLHETSNKDYLDTFFAGMLFFYISIYAVYILVLLSPLYVRVKTTDTRTGTVSSNNLKWLKKFVATMTADFSETPTNHLKIILVIFLLAAFLAGNYFYKIISDVILINLLIVFTQFQKKETIKEKILNSIKPVIQAGKFVSIDKEKIDAFAQKLKDVPLKDWDNEMQFLGTPEQTILYYFFVDSINFCFWQEKGKARWEVQKDGQWISGYYAFSWAIKKAFLANEKLQKVKTIVELTFDDFRQIFYGKPGEIFSEGELLLLEQRYKIIKQNFRVLQEQYWESVKYLLGQANGDVNRLVKLLMNDFSSFKDVSKYHGQPVYFLKRAQLFVGDLYHAFKGQSYGRFDNIGDLAICIDYKIPQLLQAEGVLVYSDKLKSKIQNEELITKDSEEEVEIRANTIYACELLREKLSGLSRPMASNDLDWLLWNIAKDTQFLMPYHKTITTNY